MDKLVNLIGQPKLYYLRFNLITLHIKKYKTIITLILYFSKTIYQP